MGASLVANECGGNTLGFESSSLRYAHLDQRQESTPLKRVQSQFESEDAHHLGFISILT